MSCMHSAAAERCARRHRPPLWPGAEVRARREWWRHVTRLALVWIGRSGQRRALGELDARLLDDIGVSAEAARKEAEKPFWRD